MSQKLQVFRGKCFSDINRSLMVLKKISPSCFPFGKSLFSRGIIRGEISTDVCGEMGCLRECGAGKVMRISLSMAYIRAGHVTWYLIVSWEPHALVLATYFPHKGWWGQCQSGPPPEEVPHHQNPTPSHGWHCLPQSTPNQAQFLSHLGEWCQYLFKLPHQKPGRGFRCLIFLIPHG